MQHHNMNYNIYDNNRTYHYNDNDNNNDIDNDIDNQQLMNEAEQDMKN